MSDSKIVGLLYLVLVVPFAILRGWVFALLWAWFVTPLFPGAPTLAIAQAIGLMLVVGLATHQWRKDPEPDDLSERVLPLVIALIQPLIALGVGAVVRGFLP